MLFVLTVGLNVLAVAESDKTFTTGDRLRIAVKKDTGETDQWIGDIVSLDNSMLVLKIKDSDKTKEFPVPAIQQYEICTGRHGLANLGKGAGYCALGTFAGAFGGAVLGVKLLIPCIPWMIYSGEGWAMTSMVLRYTVGIGAVAGSAIGLTAGLIEPIEKWKEVPFADPVGLLPRNNGRIRLGMAIDF
jgi:hypothetical protein